MGDLVIGHQRVHALLLVEVDHWNRLVQQPQTIIYGGKHCVGTERHTLSCKTNACQKPSMVKRLSGICTSVSEQICREQSGSFGMLRYFGKRFKVGRQVVSYTQVTGKMMVIITPILHLKHPVQLSCNACARRINDREEKKMTNR